MEWPKIKKILDEEILSDLEIETEALTSASLGQVHRARIKKTGASIVLMEEYRFTEKTCRWCHQDDKRISTQNPTERIPFFKSEDSWSFHFLISTRCEI